MKKVFKGRKSVTANNHFIKNLFTKIWGLILRLFFLNRVITKREKQVLYFTFLALLVSASIKTICFYLDTTKEVPNVGGVYTEALIGQPEFINPVLARTDNDKSACSLIYEGLISLDNKNQAIPKLAESWEISADQKVYTFKLKEGVVWHDGKPLNSSDVSYTFDTIKDPEQKSPLFNNFKDVLVEPIDNNTVRFTLANPYGPFLTNLNVGLIPAGKTLTDLNLKPIGIGPYKYLNSNTKNGQIERIILERNTDYWAEKPYLKKIEFKYVSTENEAKNLFEQEEVSAVNININRANSTIYNYQTSAKIMLILNLQIDPFKDKAIRQFIKNNQKTDREISFDIIVLDTPELISSADALKEKLVPLGFKVNVITLKDNDFKERLSKRDFQAMILGIDFGHDIDPYSLWHSSQMASGMNFAGFNLPSADKIIEEARILADPNARQTKYEEFNKIFTEEIPALVLTEKQFYLTVDNRVKNVSVQRSLIPAERFLDIQKWYLDTKRVKK